MESLASRGEYMMLRDIADENAYKGNSSDFFFFFFELEVMLSLLTPHELVRSCKGAFIQNSQRRCLCNPPVPSLGIHSFSQAIQ